MMRSDFRSSTKTQIDFLRNIGRGFDPQAIHAFAAGAALLCHKLTAQNIGGKLAHLFIGAAEFHAAPLSPRPPEWICALMTTGRPISRA